MLTAWLLRGGMTTLTYVMPPFNKPAVTPPDILIQNSPQNCKQMEFITSESYRGYSINIWRDENCASPREDRDNLGTMYTAHRRYCPEFELDSYFDINEIFDGKIGNFKKSFLSRYIAVPVYLYDHSGQTVRTWPFSDPWDSGFFGIVAVEIEKVKREYNWKVITAKRRKQIEECLESEVKEYDMYLRNDIYGFDITPEEEGMEDINDSCWGFYGEDSFPYMISEAKSSIDYALQQQIEKIKDKEHEAVISDALAIVSTI